MLGRFLLTLGSLFVVALFAALLVPHFVDWSDFKREFESQASRILGKKVVVHGSVEARLIPFPSVTLNDVRAGSDEDGSPLVQATRFSMDMELAPFLSGEVRIFDMRVEEPKARIRLLQDGTLDWMRGSQSLIPSRAVVLENVKIENGSVEFIDEQTGRNRLFSDLNVTMSASSLVGPWRAEGSGSIDGVLGDFTMTTSSPDLEQGRLPVRLRLMPDQYPLDFDLDGALTIAESKPLYSGSFGFNLRKDDLASTKTDRQEQANPLSDPRLKGLFQLTNERIRISSYRLELGASENPYVITGEATLDTGASSEFLLTADGQQIDVSRFSYPNTQKGKTDRVQALTVAQRIEAMAAIIGRIPVPQVPGKATISLPALVSDDTTIRDIRLDVRPQGQGWEIVNAVATLPGRTHLEANGALTLTNGAAFVGNLLVASNQPSGLANWLTGSVDPALRQLSAAGFSSDVNLTTSRQTFEKLEIAIGDASLYGHFERKLDNKVSQLDVDLSGDAMDIDALRSLAGLAIGDQLDEKVLVKHITMKLKADAFSAYGVNANNVDIAFALNDGILNVENFTASDLAGAEIKAKGQFGGNLLDYKGSARLEVIADDMQPLLSLIQQKIPNHPIMERLVNSANWYDNTNVAFDLSLDSKEVGTKVAMSGTVNGSRLSGVVKVPDLLNITDDTALSVDAVFKNPSPVILFGQAGMNPLPFDAEADGLLAIKLNGEIGKPLRTEITFSTERTRFVLNGNYNFGRDAYLEGSGALELESADVEPYLMMNAVAIPDFGIGLPVSLKSNVVITRDAVELNDFVGSIADNALNSKLAISREDDHAITGELSLGNIDFHWLASSVYGSLVDPTSGELNTATIASSYLSNFKADIRLSADSFTAPPVKGFGKFSAQMVLADGNVTLKNISTDLLGGNLAGNISMSSGAGAGIFRSNLVATAIDPQSVLWTDNEVPVAKGRFDGSLNIEATGGSIKSLIDGAAGSGEIKTKSLVLMGINPDVLTAIISSAEALDGEIDAAKVRPIVDAYLWQSELPLQDFTLPFSISSGQMRINNIGVSTDKVDVSLNSNVSLDGLKIGADILFDFNPGIEVIAGANPSIRLNYTGLLAEPLLSVDVSSITGFLASRAFDIERKRVELLQSSILEKQRLRREAVLYNDLAKEREVERQRVLEEEARKIAEEELRLKREAEQKVEEDARLRRIEQEAKAAIEARDNRAEPLINGNARPANTQSNQPKLAPGFAIPPTEQIIREALPDVENAF